MLALALLAALSPAADSYRIHIDKTAVQVEVTVVDSRNRPVTTLERENFRLLEDRAEQSISFFHRVEGPLSMGVLFDSSASMEGKLDQSRRAIRAFLEAANPRDEAFLIEFNDRPSLVARFTDHLDELPHRLLEIAPHGRTALLDAIYLGVREMARARHPRKALLVLSDGGDNSSRYRVREVRAALAEADVQLYAIGIAEMPLEEPAGPALLHELAEAAGGRYLQAQGGRDLVSAAAQMGVEMRSQYVLGYSPANRARDGKYRRVEVKLLPPPGSPRLRAYWRRGYYAPAH